MMKTSALVLLIIGFCLTPAITVSAQERHALFTEILHDYVHDGHVRYERLCRDSRLPVYLGQLRKTEPDSLSGRREELAFWLNAYNAFTLKLICDNYPLNSINELHFGGLYIGTLLKKTAWDRKFITIGARTLSLNDIEHKIIRAQFGDPRVHFALVCASKSCPPLREEAYEGYLLPEQLDDQGMRFFAQKEKNRFDIADHRAIISPILKWYHKDFGGNREAVLTYISRFLPDSLRAAILTDPSA
ncbi:MAG: DUF547 domain-containing protein, partial [Candidatus Zixiibacteriota bacterium]